MKYTDNFDSIKLNEPIFKDVKYYVTGKLPERVRKQKKLASKLKVQIIKIILLLLNFLLKFPVNLIA